VHGIEQVLDEVERASDEIVQYTRDLVRIPTVNPPGDEYEACSQFIGRDLEARGFDVEYIAADGRPEHTSRHPRINVVGTRRGGSGRVVHLNGLAAGGRSIRLPASCATAGFTVAAFAI
jgi:succinyl-diaminopimelate desuccinylase